MVGLVELANAWRGKWKLLMVFSSIIPSWIMLSLAG
jgi:hypothetical protein